MGIDICLSPVLIPYYNLEGKIVVVVDILRASSVICAALANGIDAVTPVANIEEARRYKKNGYLVAAERKGELAEGFDLGNSPQAFFKNSFSGRSLVLTTTNGTQAIESVKNKASAIYVGCFSNASALIASLENAGQPILILCAGWRNYFSLEDSLFSGYLLNSISNNWERESDSALAMQSLFEANATNWKDYLKQGTHPKRLEKIGNKTDIDYCISEDQVSIVPAYRNGALIAL